MSSAAPRPVTEREAERPRADARVLLSTGLPYLAALLVTIYVCWGPLHGRLFGDLGDARWTVAVHEHWLRVWQGRDGIRDMQYFAPLHSTLGTSDAFLAQGQIYAVIRALGVDMVTSWTSTQVVFFMLGAIGVAALSRRLFVSAPAQVAFVVLTCMSYPVVVDTGHVQLIGFLSASWVALGVCEVLQGRRAARGWTLVLLGLPLLALSSWYPAILLVVVLLAIGAYLALFTPWPRLRQRAGEVARTAWLLLRRPLGIVVVLVAVGLWVAVAWVYFPASNLLPKPTWLETTLYAPRLSDIVNAAGSGGGLWAPLYERFFSAQSFNYEQARGFTPVLFFLFLVLGLVHLRRVAVAGRLRDDRLADVGTRAEHRHTVPGSRVLAAMWLACVTVFLVIVVDERDLSVYEPIFRYVPGMSSIRSPFRVQTLVYAVAFLVLLRSLEMFAVRGRGRTASGPGSWTPRSLAVLGLGLVLCGAVGLEMVRPQSVSWNAADFLRPELRAQLPAAMASCDAVVLPVQSGGDPLLTQVDAVAFSALSGLPTPQGYGRADPIGHPGGGASAQSLADWMTSQGFDGRICSVTPESVRQIGR